MDTFLSRRAVLLAGVGALVGGCATPAAPTPTTTSGPATTPADDPALADLERRFGGRLGVAAVDTGSGATVRHRADERFLMCSTSKLLAAAAILRLRHEQAGLLDRVITYTPAQLVVNSPETQRHTSMTVSELCRAAMTLSDNTAMNLLLEVLGGPPALTAFARAIGDPVTRQDRTEPELNRAAPGDERDTSTPAQMAANLRGLALGGTLDPEGRDLLVGWLGANTTGATRIRAGLPADWAVGDKTGAGGQGEVNDVAVVRPPGRAPLVIAVYTAPTDPTTDAAPTVAEAASIVARTLVPA
ncbi:class A beta-lactamase [Pseudonocardia yuanmonensis]|uniref:class A beta-lactamase n=1 Tax=Pseudonocardia yuanmonensis TaxID=1095914 RepID=UPI003CD070F4